MELVIPDGAQVHITVGQPPLLALPHEARGVAPSYGGQRGRIGKSLVAGVLLFGAFQAGRFLPHHAETAAAAQTQVAPAGPGATMDGASGDIPPAFRAQIAQPPKVVPPPGVSPSVPASSAGGAARPPDPGSPFGLHG